MILVSRAFYVRDVRDVRDVRGVGSVRTLGLDSVAAAGAVAGAVAGAIVQLSQLLLEVGSQAIGIPGMEAWAPIVSDVISSLAVECGYRELLSRWCWEVARWRGKKS